jgi:DNA-binding PadR family transcriptional regulator
MRRKPGQLVPLELAILSAVARLQQTGVRECHGYEIAKHMSAVSDQRLLTAYGTLYRALGRLEKMGLVESHWEDPQIAANAARPGRRLYTLTGAGAAAVRAAATEARAKAALRRRQVARA